ncbi:MAG: DUF433 domain-containing protein [Planctomycetota bacterium]
MSWRERIVVDSAVCHGQACFKGTRVMVSVVLDNMAAGTPTGELLTSYPSLSEDDVLAALAYAAELSKARSLPLEPASSE